MKVLYLDCFSGISGDMMVGALCDLGVKPSALEWELSKVNLGDFHMHFERAQRKNIEGVKFSIHGGATHEHEHEGEQEHAAAGELHDHEHGEETHAHSHGGAHGHAHEDHEHEHHDCGHDRSHRHHHGSAHEHEHGRTHAQIRTLIEESELSAFVKKHALGIFSRIATAEGKIHGKPPAEVGFHEVGALDSIADIICTCVALEALGVQAVHASALHEGHGTIECAHGTFPLPAPATLEILAGIPIGQIDEEHELITPTGAGILAEFAQSFGLMPRLRTEKIGYGVGTRDLASRPNVLRAVLGELADA